MAQFPPGKRCFYRARRKRIRVYSAKDVGRIVAYARNDGAPDILLIAYILQSFGLRSLQCLLFRVLDILNVGIFLGAILLILKGLGNILKVVKILTLGKKSKITINILELVWPKRFIKSLASFLLWIGSAELAIGTVTIFITALSNNAALYLLMKGVCEAEVDQLKIEIEPLDTSSLYDDISDAITVMETVINDNL